LLDVESWETVVRAFPFIAHWIDAEAITDVKLMAKIEDRQRTFVLDGVPVGTGVIPLGDAWACTNPSLGRGISMGMMHAAALRSLLRETPLDDPRALATRWHELTSEKVGPFFADSLSFDRHRLGEVEAAIEGRPYDSDAVAGAGPLRTARARRRLRKRRHGRRVVTQGSTSTPGLRTPFGSTVRFTARSAWAKSSGRCTSYPAGRCMRPTA
jgi:hypothetical protein